MFAIAWATFLVYVTCCACNSFHAASDAISNLVLESMVVRMVGSVGKWDDVLTHMVAGRWSQAFMPRAFYTPFFPFSPLVFLFLL